MIKKGNWSKEEDLEVIRLFKLGYTSKKIGEKLDRTKEAVQKRIQNFKIEGIINEEERKLKQIENRDIKRRTGFGLPVFCCFWGVVQVSPSKQISAGTAHLPLHRRIH